MREEGEDVLTEISRKEGTMVEAIEIREMVQGIWMGALSMCLVLCVDRICRISVLSLGSNLGRSVTRYQS